jgi:mannose-6-phosphate isomerase-like protein (cupin superfamily)
VSAEAFDLSTTYVHLGLGSSADPVPDFEWSPEFLQRYVAAHEQDGDEGRLVMIGPSAESWDFWERHPAGDEVVVVLSGQMTLIQDLDGTDRRIDLGPGMAAINPRGVWHTSDVHQPGETLFVTPGRRTEHRPR